MTVLAYEQQALVGAISRTGMPTPGTCLATVMGINLDRHRIVQEGFVGNHGMQFGKAPLGVGSVRLSLLFARRLALLATGPFSNMGQVFQPDEAMGVLFNDAFGDDMVSVLL